MAATTRVKVPTFNSDNDDYDTYMHEVDMWKIIGKVYKKEQAMMLVYELSKTDSSGIRDKILNEISIADLNKDDGLDTYIKYMDKHFKKDESVATYEAYLNFERCKKKVDEEIKAYILRFDKQSNIAKKKQVTYPNLVLALKLLDNCMLSDVDRKLVLSEMDFTQTDVYDKTKGALVKYKSNTVCSNNANNMNFKSEFEIKTEETAMVTKSSGLEEALVAAGWHKPRSNSNPERGGYRRHQNRRNDMGPPFSGKRNNDFQGNQFSGKNPIKNGEQKRCFICESTHHMRDQCPHRVPNLNNNNKNNKNNNNDRYDRAYTTDAITLSDRTIALARNDEENAYSAVDSAVLYTVLMFFMFPFRNMQVVVVAKG